MDKDDNDEPFSIHVEGETSGKLWTGDFRAKKRLTHRDHLNKDRFRRELLGGEVGIPTERADTTSKILSEIWVRLTKTPPWWEACGNGIDLIDDKVIAEIYNKASKIEADEIEAKTKKATEAQEKLRAEAAKAAAEEKAAKEPAK